MAGVVLVFEAGDELKIDATLTQTHGHAAEVTKHPVEDGADVSDHYRSEPRRLMLQCVISQVEYGAGGGVTINSATGRVDLAGSAPPNNRHKLAFDRLEKAMAERELVTVRTGLMVYRNMAITAFSPVREARTGFDLVFPLELEEVLFAKTQTAQASRRNLGAATPGASKAQAAAQISKTQDQASPAGNKGQKGKAPATPAQQARTQSWLSSARAWLGV